MAYSSVCLCPKFPPLIRTPDTGFSESESRSVVSDSLSPHGLQPARLLSPWNSPGKNTGVGSQFSSPGDLPNPGFKHRSPALQADSSSFEPSGRPPINVFQSMKRVHVLLCELYMKYILIAKLQ